MSLNRLLLRASACSAIANFWQAPFPTLAEHLIFDSKVEPIENMEVDVVYPTVVVYTDYDKNHVAHQDIGYTTREMTITFELLMAVLSKSEDPEPVYNLSTPYTDSQLEASLDVLEAQVFAALRADNSAANCFRTIAYGASNVVSRRGATTEGGTKIAARQVTYEARVLQELASPILPAFAEPFLAELEASPGMDSMATTIRGLYTLSNNVAGLERLRQTMGWSKDVQNALGYPLPSAPNLGTPVVWLDQFGNPI